MGKRKHPRRSPHRTPGYRLGKRMWPSADSYEASVDAIASAGDSAPVDGTMIAFLVPGKDRTRFAADPLFAVSAVVMLGGTMIGEVPFATGIPVAGRTCQQVAWSLMELVRADLIDHGLLLAEVPGQLMLVNVAVTAGDRADFAGEHLSSGGVHWVTPS